MANLVSRRKALLAFGALGAAAPAAAEGAEAGGHHGPAVDVGLFSALESTTVPAGADFIRTTGYRRVGVGQACYRLDGDQGDSRGASLTRGRTMDGRWFLLAEPEWAPEMLGAVGGDAAHDGPALQGILDVGKPLIGRAVQYELGPKGLLVRHDAQVIRGNRMLLNYTGSGHGLDLDEGFARGRWAQDCYFENFYLLCESRCLSGIRWRFSHSTAINVSVGVLRSDSTAWRLEVDANVGNGGAGGSGPYYSTFVNCNAVGKTMQAGVADQTGWLLTAHDGLASRAPNANQWLGGRASGFTRSFVIRGHGNKLMGVTSEAVAANGWHFRIENAASKLGDAGCYANMILSPYLEGNAGANGFYIGPTSYGSAILFDAPTSFGGTLFEDHGRATTWQRAEGLYMPNQPSQDPRTFDHYEEGRFKPVLYGSKVKGANVYSVQDGAFTRMGDRVHFDVALIFKTGERRMSGSLRIGGLPFTSAADNVSSVAISNIRLDLNAGYTAAGGRIDGSHDYIVLVQTGSGASPTEVPSSAASAVSEIYLSGTYRV